MGTVLTPRTARRAVNIRSVALGLVGVVVICTVTPFNNYVLYNNDVISHALPIAMLLFMLVVVLAVNAPLHRWAPRRAFAGDELAVAMAMVLVACALPSVGLMRYLPGHVTAFFYHAATSADYADLLRGLGLPDWIFPSTEASATDPAAKGLDPVIQDFVGRVPIDSSDYADRFAAVPWSAWTTPALTWGVFFAALFGASIFLSLIFRRQWTENERLPFPLASICLSLIEPPAPGRAINRLFRSRAFWVAFAVVFFIHGVNALNTYFPVTVPEIPLDFDLRRITVHEPWKYIEPYFKLSRVYFTIIGITLFVQTKVSFSLWFCFAAVQAARMLRLIGDYQETGGMEMDQTFGAVVPFGLMIVWVGRHHLAAVARQMFRRGRPDDPAGRYLPHAFAGWGFIVCLVVLVAWLVVAGASVIGAVVIVLMLVLFYLVVAKIIAETGLLYVLIQVPLTRPWVFLANDLPSVVAPLRTTMRSYFFASWFSGMLTHDLRNCLPAFSTTAVRIADERVASESSGWRSRASFIAVLALALVVAYFVSGAGMLYSDYSYAATLNRPPQIPISWWGGYEMPRLFALEMTRQYMPPGTGPHESHDRPAHFAFGAAVTTLLSVLRLRYDWWPLHPVGFLMCYSWGIKNIWFSVLIGWLIKVLIVRFGGAELFLRARTFFVGLILGESGAIAFWIIVSAVLASMGYDYKVINMLPNK